MSAGDPSAAASGAAASSNVATVPGLSGAGPGTNGQRGSSSSGSGSNSGNAVSGASGSASTGFVQSPPVAKTGSGASQGTEKVLQGSLFAVLVAVVGILVM